MRAFLALEPSITVCERLVLLQEDLSDPVHLLGGDVTWRRGDQLRVLLRGFEIEPAQLRWVEGALAQALSPLPPFDFTVSGTRFIPSEECARFIVAGVDAAAESIEQLLDAIEPVLARAGIGPESREWLGMIPIGRLRTGDDRPRLAGVVRAFSETIHGTTTASSAVLTTSEVFAGRVRTKQQRRFVFGGDATSGPSPR